MYKNMKCRWKEGKKYTFIRLNGVSTQKTVITLIVSLKPEVSGKEKDVAEMYIREKGTEFQLVLRE
jgi:hypothetical protein